MNDNTNKRDPKTKQPSKLTSHVLPHTPQPIFSGSDPIYVGASPNQSAPLRAH